MIKREKSKLLRNRSSTEVEKLAQAVIEKILITTTILERNPEIKYGDTLISHRVHKSRVKTAYGGYVNTGEDLFKLFDIFIIYKGEDFFIQVSDNLHRVLKPYRKFLEDTLNTKNIIIMGRIMDYKRTIVWQFILVRPEGNVKFSLKVDYSKAPNTKDSEIIAIEKV